MKTLSAFVLLMSLFASNIASAEAACNQGSGANRFSATKASADQTAGNSSSKTGK